MTHSPVLPTLPQVAHLPCSQTTTINDSCKLESVEDLSQLTDQTKYLKPLRLCVLFAALAVAVCMSVLDSTMVSTALPTISASLNGGNKASYIGTAYLLAQASLCPVWSRLSDVLGRRGLLLFCLVHFFLSSLACALATSMVQLIIFRAMQGLSGGSFIVIAQAITCDVVSMRERGKYQAIFEIIIAAANGAGPLLGGVFARINWRLCFWVKLPLCGLALALCWVLVPRNEIKGDWQRQCKQIDWLGAVLVIAGSCLLLLGLNWGGVEYRWLSLPVLATLIAGLTVFAAFSFWEASRWTVLPIIPMRFFLNRTAVGIFSNTIAGGIALYAILFYVPQFLQISRGFSTIRSGIFMIPFLVPITLVIVVCGFITARTGNYYWSIAIGSALQAIALGLLTTWTIHTSDAKIIGTLFFVGFSTGPTLQTSVIAIQAAVQKGDRAVASGVRLAFKHFGSLLGVAIGSAMINNSISGPGITASLKAHVIDDPTTVRNLDPVAFEAVLNAYEKGFQRLFIVVSALAAVACLCNVFLVQQFKLSKEESETAKQVCEKTTPMQV